VVLRSTKSGERERVEKESVFGLAEKGFEAAVRVGNGIGRSKWGDPNLFGKQAVERKDGVLRFVESRKKYGRKSNIAGG